MSKKQNKTGEKETGPKAAAETLAHKSDTENVVFGLLDNSSQFPDKTTANRARDLTISWARFKYSGPIYEDINVENILQRAVDAGANHCLIQSYGHILAEIWRPDASDTPEIMQALDDWVKNDYLACGYLFNKQDNWYGLDQLCLLVNLKLARQQGLEVLLEELRQGQGICEFPYTIKAGLNRLDPLEPAAWKAGQPPAPSGKATKKLQPEKVQSQCPPSENSDTEKPSTEPADGAFLADVHHLTENLRNAIFVWNLESYEDIETPSRDFKPPLNALYTVSAGFKPNRILETHGFDRQTRMVVYDYSPQGLEFRRMLHEEWQGVDYPSFLKKLFRKVSSAEAHYLLWDGMSPENLDWSLVNRRWQEELTAWGGEEALHQHWQKFRKLKIEYLNCNILTENDQLLSAVKDQDNALIWWSNAFFSVYSNWFYSITERQALYKDWIRKLAEKAPNIFMYGSDCHNISVNIYRARLYANWLKNLSDPAQFEHGSLQRVFDVLEPSKFHQYDMRY